ncbi:hypothetical protein COCC4DRAFT_29468 [Bipolaris maydis ATCC 48331]|uniref:Uncharacterized protein n=2 Tax=Cochliobolus heterostrophus TaxID=5016 RepID=M2UQY0_COCH5|nr:uncharacterized protein COCC4DRAFT_29468 [Bipolaris maydis ATCC 48331]EMD95991.1 hypothetical protein COCHEDRAFT_1019481 [Bipolaris maydis C5]ENI10849.1 hypothetical protein COCC4DRAFT_29468 [Bipolaris maydis ATCC 48331]
MGVYHIGNLFPTSLLSANPEEEARGKKRLKENINKKTPVAVHYPEISNILPTPFMSVRPERDPFSFGE